MSAGDDRAAIFAKLPLEDLRRARNEAASAGRLDMANEILRAMNLRVQSQHEEIEHCGQLFEHVEQPSPQNGGRFITTYTGDPSAWMNAFTGGAQVCKLNRDPGVVSRQTVDLKAGERIQVLGRDGTTRAA